MLVRCFGSGSELQGVSQRHSRTPQIGRIWRRSHSLLLRRRVLLLGACGAESYSSAPAAPNLTPRRLRRRILLLGACGAETYSSAPAAPILTPRRLRRRIPGFGFGIQIRFLLPIFALCRRRRKLQALTYGRGPPGPVVRGVLRTPGGVVNVRPNAMSRPRKADGLLKSPVRSPPSSAVSGPDGG